MLIQKEKHIRLYINSEKNTENAMIEDSRKEGEKEMARDRTWQEIIVRIQDSYMPKSFRGLTLKVKGATEAFLAEKWYGHVYTL